MSEVPLPRSSRSGVEVERPRQDERPRAVHARLHLVDEEQVALAFPARVEVADHDLREPSHAADRLDQFQLHHGELMAFQQRVDLLRGIRGEGIDVVDVGVEGLDAFLVGRIGRARQREQGLAPEARLEGQDVAPREPGDQGDLEGVLHGGRPADGGQEAFEAGEVPEPAAELVLDGWSGSSSSDLISSA